MPRNSSGTYNLVAGNPVITGTIIQSDWANTTMPDIGNELTDSLSRSGKGGMTAPLSLLQGSAASPSMTFGSFPQSGMYAATANDIRMSVAGVDRFRWLNANALPQTWDSVGGVWLDVGGGGVIWSEVDVLPNPVLISNGYSTLGGQTAVLPPNPPVGFSIAFADKADNWSATNFLTLDGNGNTFTQDGTGTYILDLKGAFAQFSFLDGQWQIVNFGRLSDYYGVDTDDFALKTEVNAKPNENLLINGGFDVAQRGLSFTTTGYTLDRWDVGTGGATNLWQQVVLAPVNADFIGAPFYMDWTKSVAGASLGNMNQKIENVHTAANKTVTLSFWARSLDGGSTDFAFLLQQNFGTAGSAAVTATLPTFSIGTGTDWTYYEFTADVPAISGKVVGDDSFLKLQVSPINISDTFSIGITAVKLEIGSVATPYQARPLGEELALCQRYYWKEDPMSRLATIYNSNNVARACWVDFPVTMRSTPVVAFTDSGFSGAPLAAPTTSGIRFAGAASSGTANTVVTNITADAEL